MVLNGGRELIYDFFSILSLSDSPPAPLYAIERGALKWGFQFLNKMSWHHPLARVVSS
jgi:hypothetical protein